MKGGVFRIEISWVCDFDFGRSIDDCEPKYSFSRVDDRKFKISKGWNFRYADYHEENRRTLHKVFGLQLLISAVGEGGKFELFEAIKSLGAMVGLITVASLVCDFLFDVLCLLNTLPCQAMKNYKQDIRFGNDEYVPTPVHHKRKVACSKSMLNSTSKPNSSKMSNRRVGSEDLDASSMKNFNQNVLKTGAAFSQVVSNSNQSTGIEISTDCVNPVEPILSTDGNEEEYETDLSGNSMMLSKKYSDAENK